MLPCLTWAIQEIQDGVKDGFKNTFVAEMVIIMIYYDLFMRKNIIQAVFWHLKSFTNCLFHIPRILQIQISEYDQEIPQSQTAD